MFNYYYLMEIRRDFEGITPALITSYIFNKDLEEKDNLWLLFEDAVLVNRNEIDVKFEHNLANILLISNKVMSEQIIKTLYNNDYNPFTDEINLEWFNKNQQQYLIKIMNELLSLEKAVQNILLGVFREKTFILSEYNSKDINIKDFFFEYGVDILFTYEIGAKKIKIYFNNYSMTSMHIKRMIDRINTKYPCFFIPDSNSVEIIDTGINTWDIFNLLNEYKEQEEKKVYRFKNKYKG